MTLIKILYSVAFFAALLAIAFEARLIFTPHF